MPGESSRRRLTQAEAAFLYAETPQTPMHVGGCGLYAGKLSKDTLCDLIASRLDRLPQYRRKAVFAPLNLAHPTWEDDPDFDLSRHIDEIELPPPADDRVISRVCGQLFSAPLDRDRPLWKLTLIHGRPDGDSMVLARVHQAMLEGVSGIDLMLTLHDFRSRPTPGTPGTWRPEVTPDALSLLQEAVRDRITEVVQWWTDNSFQFFRSPNQTSYAKRVVNGCLSLSTTLLHPTPGTPFNADLSGRRELVWLELSFADARFIRSVLRGSVDDVVLALIAGGIGRYLRSKGVDTDGLELRAALPRQSETARAAPPPRRPGRRSHLDHAGSAVRRHYRPVAPVFGPPSRGRGTPRAGPGRDVSRAQTLDDVHSAGVASGRRTTDFGRHAREYRSHERPRTSDSALSRRA